MKRPLPSMAALQSYEAVARHLSVTRAAEELHLTQSAVSKQIAQLESLLERDLFKRVRKRLQITPAGELYLAEIKKILNHVEMSSRYILSYGGDTEVLTVATPATFGGRWLIPGLKGFGARHPSIHLDIRVAQSGLDRPQTQADVVFFFGESPPSGMTSEPLFEERLAAVCTPDLRAAMAAAPPGAGRSTSVTHAIATNVLLQCAARPEAWREWFLGQGEDLDRAYHGPRFETFDMAISAAKAGCGVALAPLFLVADDLAEGKLAQVSDHVLESVGRYQVAYAEHMADTPKIRALLQWVQSRAAVARTDERR